MRCSGNGVALCGDDARGYFALQGDAVHRFVLGEAPESGQLRAERVAIGTGGEYSAAGGGDWEKWMVPFSSTQRANETTA